METEIMRLKDLLEMKLRDIDEMRIRLSEVQQVHPRIRNYEERIALLQEEINQVTNAFRDKSAELESWRVKHQGALQERDFISNELERVKYILEEKIRENESLKRRFEDLEHENQRLD
jgi:chromosome segregation ATPase